MAHQLSSLDNLVTFAEVGKCRSFSRAARALHVTPSAVSHRIADLERQLGVELFARTTRSVRPTDAGRVLLASVESGLELIHEGFSKVSSATAQPSLTVSCSPSFAIRWLLPQVGNFRREFPELELHVAADDRLFDPRRDDIDVCIRYGAGNYAGLVARKLATEWVFPVCSPEFQKRHRLRRPAQLERLRLIHHDVLRDHPARVDWPRWLRRAGVEGQLRGGKVHFSHAHLALSAALAGEGVALGRTSLVKEDLARGHLVAPFGPRLRSGLSYYLVTSPGARPEVELFGKWVRRAMRAPLAGGGG